MPKGHLIAWYLLGTLLLGLSVFLSQLSHQFDYNTDGIDEPIALYTAVTLFACLVYVVLVYLIARVDAKRTLRSIFRWMIFIGLAMRVMFLFSNLVLEDDHYRYLWEGGLLANQINPYAVSPEDVIKGRLDNHPQADRIQALAKDSGVLIHRINHPQYRSVYPLSAQLCFALSYLVKPWDLFTWRCILLCIDLLSIWAMFRLLVYLGKSPIWLGIFWLNPLMAKETINSAHVDGLMIPLLLWAFIMAYNKRFIIANFLIALAAGVKLWPVLLVPFIFKLAKWDKKILFKSTLTWLYVCLIFAFPVYLAGFGDDLGFNAYGKKWEMNDGLYMLIFKGAGLFTSVFLQKHFIARCVAIFVLVLVGLYLLRNKDDSFQGFMRSCCFVVATLFMVSPTQFPWYYLWVMPFLVFVPRPSLILLSCLLPIYYLRFHYSARDAVLTFDEGVVWIQYIPVLILMVLELKKDAIRAFFSPKPDKSPDDFTFPHY